MFTQGPRTMQKSGPYCLRKEQAVWATGSGVFQQSGRARPSLHPSPGAQVKLDLPAELRDLSSGQRELSPGVTT